jgi:hypothetical protein
MNKAVDSIVRPTRALQAAGYLVMAVAGLVHFWYCDWDLSFLGKNSEPEMSDVQYIVGPVYPDESFPGNVWEASLLGVMLPGSLVLVGLFLLALADNRQTVPLRGGDERRRTSVPLVAFGQAGRLPCESTQRIPPTNAARPLATRRCESEPVAAPDALDRDTQQYIICPLCGCFSIIQRHPTGRFIECPFCLRSIPLGDRVAAE